MITKPKFGQCKISIPTLILRATAPNNLRGSIAHPCLKVFSFRTRDFLGQQSKLIQMCKVAKLTKAFLLSDGMTEVTRKWVGVEVILNSKKGWIQLVPWTVLAAFLVLNCWYCEYSIQYSNQMKELFEGSFRAYM